MLRACYVALALPHPLRLAAGERVLDTPDNPISVGMTLSTLLPPDASGDAAVSMFGSMLFSRCVSGTRAVPRGKRQEVAGITFDGYGAHYDRRVRHAPAPRRWS